MMKEARYRRESPRNRGEFERRALHVCTLLAVVLAASLWGSTSASAHQPSIDGGPIHHELLDAAGGASAPRTGVSLPAFLQDDEPAPIQSAQLRMYLETRPPEVLWRQHIAPALVAQGDALDPEQDATTTGLQQSTTDPEQVREQLRDYYADIERLLETVPDDRRMDAMERLQRAESAIDSFTAEDLAAFDHAFAGFPGLWDAPEYVRGMLEGGQPLREAQAAVDALPRQGNAANTGRVPRLHPSLHAPDSLTRILQTAAPLPPVPASAVPQYSNCADYGANGTCASCPAGPAGGIITVFSLQTVAFTAASVCSYFDGDVFPITGVEIPSPVKIACAIGTTALQLTADAVEFAYNLNGSCEQGFHRSITHAYLDAQVSTRASQKSHDFHRLWSLRIQIENALLQEGDIRLSLFQLPASQGGLLDREDDLSVKFIVNDTIEMNEAAGYDVRNAQEEYDAAIAHLNADEFKDAFARFRKAYRAAVRVGRTPVQ